MAKRGRPTWKPTAKERETVKTMTSYGIPQDAICAILKITRATLEKHCRHELNTGAADATAKVAASMFRMATSGPYATRFLAAKYWLAARAGWRDVDKPEPLVPMLPLSQLSDDAWRQLCAINRFDPPTDSRRSCHSRVGDERERSSILARAMINSRTRVRVGTWFEMLVAERERRRLLALSPPAEAAAAALLDTFEQMAERLLGSPRPGDDGAMAATLVALAREKDDAGLEAFRLKNDLAPAEVVAWLIVGGNSEAAFGMLDRYEATHDA